MVLYVGDDLCRIVKVGTVDVKAIYRGLGLAWHKDLPSGTVLLEHFNQTPRTYAAFELILPTEQEVEVELVAGGGGYNGCQADI